MKIVLNRQAMVLNFLKKTDHWSQVGGVQGYIDAVSQLGSDYQQLDLQSIGRTKSDDVWSRLASFTTIPKSDSYEARKWLFTAWHEDRRKIRSTFLGMKAKNNAQLSSTSDSSDNQAADSSQGAPVSLFNYPCGYRCL